MYVDRIYRFIYFKISNKEDAQDITSEVFLKTWQYINNKKKVQNFNALIYQIARNSVIDHYRKRTQTELVREEDILKTIHDKRSEQIIEQIDIDSDMKGIETMLLRLKDEYREVVLLRYIEEFSIKEIAEIIGKSTGATKVILHRAMKKLQSMTSNENN